MEQNYGGPVWHASAAPLSGKLALGRNMLRSYVAEVLAGVGDPSRGEWEEWTGYAFHLRRRLTPEEDSVVGPVIDIRGTPEAQRRLRKVRRYLPHDWSEE